MTGLAEFVTADPEDGEAFLSRTYGAPISLASSGEDYRLRHRRRGPGPFFLDLLDHTATIEYRCEPFPLLACLRMHRGVRTDVQFDERFGPGDLAVNARPDEVLHLRYANAAYSTVMVPLETAAAVAINTPEDDGPALRFTQLRPASTSQARTWLRTVDLVRQRLEANPAAMEHPLVHGPAARLLAAAMLTSFPNTWAPPAHPADRTDATPGALSRATAFIEANPDLDISTLDVARAARVTVRALHLSFRRQLDTTPVLFLRRVRLEGAREHLVTAAPGDGTTVRDVAARWGYADASRFASHYRQAYGEAPSSTLAT